MKTLKSIFPRAALFVLIFTVVCGLVYTAVVTGLAQLIFPHQANGSIIEVDGKKYGCERLVSERVEKLKKANPGMDGAPVPVDLVTCSGSGLDPDISPAAAEYQVERIAKASGLPADDVRAIVEKCTNGRFLGLFGEETVNVLRVNLMLDGILK